MEKALIGLAIALLDSETGIEEYQYDCLSFALEKSDIPQEKIDAILSRVEATDGFIYLPEGVGEELYDLLIGD